MENEQLSEELRGILKGIERLQVHRVWQQAKRGEVPEDPEEARMAKVMKNHPQYYYFWENAGNIKAGRELDVKEANPFLHLTFETILEGQLESKEVPEVRQTLRSLVQNGMDEHEARHAVCNVLIGEIWHVLKEKREFRLDAYRSKLKKLARRRR